MNIEKALDLMFEDALGLWSEAYNAGEEELRLFAMQLMVRLDDYEPVSER